MGRKIPLDHHHYNYNNSHHPLLTLSLFIVSIAATLSIVTVLCGFLTRKKDELEQEGLENANPNNNEKNESQETPTSPRSNNEAEDETLGTGGEAPLPPPPAMRTAARASSYHYRLSSQASSVGGHKKLGSSMSMRVPGKDSKRDDNERDKKHHHNKKLKHEDSIWKKTIILGEKCRVRNEEEDDGIVCDENGNRITPYHPKTSSTIPMSRQNSAMDEEALRIEREEGKNGI